MRKRRTPEGMTRWEAGQELIKASDTLHECAQELKDKFPEYAKELRKMALRIGTIFNKHDSHCFGLADENDIPRAPSLKDEK